jgi:hypothetical protein
MSSEVASNGGASFYRDWRSVWWPPGQPRDPARDHTVIGEVQRRLRDAGYPLGTGAIGCLSAFPPDPDFLAGSIEALEEVIRADESPLRRALAHVLWSRALWTGRNHVEISAHEEAAAHLLLDGFAVHPQRDCYLVRGFEVVSDLADRWEVVDTGREVQGSTSSFDLLDFRLEVPGAFQLLVRCGRFQEALSIYDLSPAAFQSPGVQGWLEVCRAVLSPRDAAAGFERAAAIFATDTLESASGRNWSAVNSNTLAPYFRARAVLAAPADCSPSDWSDRLRSARRALDPDQLVFAYPPARQLGILIHRLGEFLDGDRDALEALVKQYDAELAMWASETVESKGVSSVLRKIRDGILDFARDPRTALSRGLLADGVREAERLPVSAPARFLHELGPNLGAAALELAQGTTFREMLGLLESIEDEGTLHTLVQECLRAQSTRHAKITHGPIEYGKDVIGVIEEGDEVVLQIYAIKAGDLTMKNWPSLKEALDQASSVPVTNPVVDQLRPWRRRVVALFNGHINSYADPVVKGWIRSRREQGVDIELCSLEQLAELVRDRGLASFVRTLVRRRVQPPP